jgi:hypothetical protein
LARPGKPLDWRGGNERCEAAAGTTDRSDAPHDEGPPVARKNEVLKRLFLVKEATMEKSEKGMTLGELRGMLEAVKTAWPDVVELKAWWELMDLVNATAEDQPLSEKGKACAKRVAKLIMRVGAIPPPVCGPCFMLNHALGLKFIRPPMMAPC